MSVCAARSELDFELLAYERAHREYTEGERSERLDVYTRRLEAARAERAERMAKAKAPLGLSRLVREHDLNTTEVEILLVVACLDLLGGDSQGVGHWMRYSSAGSAWGHSGSVGWLSGLLGRDRSERMAVRELMSPGSKLVRAGLSARHLLTGSVPRFRSRGRGTRLVMENMMNDTNKKNDMTNTNDMMRARARGVWLGQLTGDALGTTLEFRRRAGLAREYPKGFREVVGGGPFGCEVGQVTDDSELALALARSLVASGDDFDVIARAYVSWCRSHPIDIGHTTRMAFGLAGEVTAERLWTHVSTVNGDPGKQANGALMRVSPLAIWATTHAPERLAELARLDAKLSHPSPNCQESNVAFVVAIAEGLNGGTPRSMYEAALRAVDTDVGREVFSWLVAAENELPDFDNWGMGWVRVALQNAFYRLLHADDFEQAVVDTVMQGGDADTNGCIVGALCGAAFGELDIPVQWREAVLSCRPRRPEFYWNLDARELAVALLG